MNADDPRHGTRNGYINLGCRCAPCREANTIAHREWSHRTGRSRPRVIRGRTHGLRSTYVHGCHCDLCREAERRYKADLRARHRVGSFAQRRAS